jgi:hypothetical protein
MNRSEFFKKIIRYILFFILAGIAIVLGRRAVTVTDCSTCPGNGICNGGSDCSSYLPE